MNKKYFLFAIAFTFINVIVFGQNITVNNQRFKIEQKEIDTLSQEVMEVFRGEKKLLSHVLLQEDGDCSSIQLELGNYKVEGNKIIFYTYWAAADRQGILMYPFGVRKQVYEVDEKGSVHLAGSEIYLEDRIGGDGNDALKLLNTNPQTEKEKQLLNNYIETIEKEFESRFVLGKEKDALMTEVKQNLGKEINTNTEHWASVYGDRVRM